VLEEYLRYFICKNCKPKDKSDSCKSVLLDECGKIDMIVVCIFHLFVIFGNDYPNEMPIL